MSFFIYPLLAKNNTDMIQTTVLDWHLHHVHGPGISPTEIILIFVKFLCRFRNFYDLILWVFLSSHLIPDTVQSATGERDINRVHILSIEL